MADAPPTSDPAFQALLARRLALRRAWMGVAALFPSGAAGGAILWALIPVVSPLSRDLAALGPAATILAGVALTALAAISIDRRFGPV